MCDKGVNKDYILTISKQELAELPVAKFDGMIKLVDSAADAEEAIATLRKSDIIGFDTETRPSFRKGSLNEVSLIQLSDRTTCFLFRINHIGFTDSLVDLLEDESLTKIGLSIHDDFHNLSRLRKIEPKGFVDLQHYVKNFNISDISLSKICAIVFGKRISKGQRLTNWEAQTLTEAQQTYASLDAMACIKIYEFLKNGFFNAEESPYRHTREEILAATHTDKEGSESENGINAAPAEDLSALSKSARRRRRKAARKRALKIEEEKRKAESTHHSAE